MKLRSKALLIITCMWTVICLAVYIDSKIVLEKKFQQQEQKLAIKNINRVRNALNNQMESLALYTNSWAQWDEAYNFMTDKSEAFIKSNFVAGTYTSAALNFFLFYDTHGQYYYGEAFNLNKNESMPVPEGLLDALSTQQAFLTHQGKPPLRSGILNTPEGAVIISSIPVIDSDGKLPSRGSLLMGYYLNSKIISDLAKTVEFNIKFHPLPLKSYDPTLVTVLSQLLSSNTNQILDNKKRNIVKGYTLINDLNNEPIGIMEINIPSFIYSEGITAINHFLIGLVVMGAIILLTLWYSLKLIVLNRIVDISKQVIDINKVGSFDKRIKLSGNDELNSMTTSLNSMIEMIEQIQVHLHYRISQRTKDLEKITKLNRNLFSEMGKQKAMEAKLREDKKLLKKMAYSDNLTNLPNRACFEDMLTKALAETSTDKKVAIIFLDIDKFKSINDTYGHDFGDKILKEIAARLKKSITSNDVAARLAGDEFIMFISNVTSMKMIDDAIENVFQNLTALINIEGIMLTPTYSMGVSIYPDDATSIEKLYHQADIAMYYAKKQQGNIYYYFSAIDTRTTSTTE